ncbi:hypothetical protein [Streptomyces sp. NPDC052811]|uniref:hypothetical protein n=1 Tax=Streptomyces sp. NPDC052811 TaxID=3155731 RepID=UPI00343404B9
MCGVARPNASESQRRSVTEQQLHQDVTARAWAKAQEREQHQGPATAAAQGRAEAAAAQRADVVADEPVAPVVLPAPRPAAVIVPAPQPEPADVDDDQELVLEEFTREQVLDWRKAA